MARLSEKQIAGFLDADGSIETDLTKGRIAIAITASQKASQDIVLYKIKDALGGNVIDTPVNGVMYRKYQLYGRKAEMALNRIVKHLVVKKHYAYACLDVAGQLVGNKKERRQWLQEQRRIKSLPLPNFPPRKWLAGYFDGDGCLGINRIRDSGVASIVAHIACSAYDTEGIEIIQKSFGGRIHGMSNGRCRQWTLYLEPSKAKEFLGYFAKHLLIKKEQAYYILGCAAIGHYHNGIEIKAALKQLKSHEHRLSDLGA